MKAVGLSFFLILVLIFSGSSFAFTPTVRFSDEFYAAQKFFSKEACRKFPKLSKDKFYPEIPIRGSASNEELKSILPLTDVYEARRAFVNEANLYPEQIYPEIFSFLYNHPGTQVSPSNKLKFAAIEIYFLPFNFLFCSDPHYYFHPNVKANPCPFVFCYTDDKKNSINFSLSSTYKTNLNLLINENLTAEYLSYQGKRPVALKAGGSQSLKFTVNLTKLKSDSVFKVVQIILNDPSEPKIKLMTSAILLPSKDFLKLPAHFYQVNYQYSSHLKSIDLYKDRTSGPERCSGNNCSGNRNYPLRSSNRDMTQYNFGESANVQFNICTQSPAYSIKSNALHLQFNELGNLEGKARDCPGPTPESSAPCPPETPNNGKQLYGSRKIECHFYVPENKTYQCRIHIEYKDLKTQLNQNPELSWLENKKLILLVTDTGGKILHKETISYGKLNCTVNNLSSGNYTLSVFPVNEDSGKLNASLEINYLNHAGRARFDFELKAEFLLLPIK